MTSVQLNATTLIRCRLDRQPAGSALRSWKKKLKMRIRPRGSTFYLAEKLCSDRMHRNSGVAVDDLGTHSTGSAEIRHTR